MEDNSMQKKWFTVLCAVIGSLAMALSSVPALATEINILLIHGRHSPCPGPPDGDYIPGTCSNPEKYGTFTKDQIGYWDLPKTPLITAAHIYYVQWDAWERHFYETGWPGGYAVIARAMNEHCSGIKDQYCYVICHSAGCAAVENYIAKSHRVWMDDPNNPIIIQHVIAAASAAGGSELAQFGCDSLGSWLIGANNIDCSLRMADARNAYNHNHMATVPIRGIAGTSNTSWTACSPLIRFPGQSSNGSEGLNTNCSICEVGGKKGRACSDDDVALHSSCGHNRVASFQDCNSRIYPYNDTAGTYDDHGWWEHDLQAPRYGPFSSAGKADYNSKFHTYRVNHGGARTLAIEEYSACPAGLCP